MRYTSLLLLIVLLVAGSVMADEAERPAFDDLCRWMTGSFSSHQQAAKDSEFADIRLEMHHIWPNQTDGYWLYIEQTIQNQNDTTYRQRIARLSKLNDSTFESTAYTIPNPERFLGHPDDSTLNNVLTPDSLYEKNGCAVTIWPTNKIMFTGSTNGRNCSVNFNGSVYGTSDVTISPKLIYSWDRGYDADNKQVWGTEKSGYFFRRVE